MTLNNNNKLQINESDAPTQRILLRLDESIKEYSNKSPQEITEKIRELHQEWDVERWVEISASTIALIGVLLGFFININWLIVPLIVLVFLLQHSIQGWCPPVILLRNFDVRTQKEIDAEIYALKFLRGDFEKGVLQKSDQARKFLER